MKEQEYPMVKFKGKFTALKKMGYTFHKLFARDYKVYMKKTKNWDINVWVAHGGYVEINDYYSNTKNIIDAIKQINWDKIKALPSFLTKELYKHTFIRFDHSNPNKGFKLTDLSIDTETFIKMGNDKSTESYKKAYNEVISEFDRQVRITEDSAKELFKELKRIKAI